MITAGITIALVITVATAAGDWAATQIDKKVVSK